MLSVDMICRLILDPWGLLRLGISDSISFFYQKLFLQMTLGRNWALEAY